MAALQVRSQTIGNALNRDPGESRAGAFVMSLDFELQWGVRDRVRLDANQKRRLILARSLVPRILDVFAKHDVKATWATVGALFAESREHLEFFAPKNSSSDAMPLRSPPEALGSSERDDPFHFAPSLIRLIAGCAGQEIGCHSFEHYCSLETGQTHQQFQADLRSAVNIAAHHGVALKSYVFPRNQVNDAYLPLLTEEGFSCYRANEPGCLDAPGPFARQRRWYKRVGRLADSYLNVCGPRTHAWPPGNASITAIGSSRYLRPLSPAFRALEDLQFNRILQSMGLAAERNQLFHLWWHPEGFADFPEMNLAFLSRVLAHFNALRDQYGMISLTMHEVASTHVTFPAASRSSASHG
jgi:peptidoglycan/xylan/chitin deacetylase (PgdA/CDA1 family)